jgi:hypothetical protein
VGPNGEAEKVAQTTWVIAMFVLKWSMLVTILHGLSKQQSSGWLSSIRVSSSVCKVCYNLDCTINLVNRVTKFVSPPSTIKYMHTSVYVSD